MDYNIAKLWLAVQWDRVKAQFAIFTERPVFCIGIVLASALSGAGAWALATYTPRLAVPVPLIAPPPRIGEKVKPKVAPVRTKYEAKHTQARRRVVKPKTCEWLEDC